MITLPKKIFVCVVAVMCCNTAASTENLPLSWDASSESHLDHYRIYYRIGSSGGRDLINYDGTGLGLSGAPLESGAQVNKDLFRQDDAIRVSVENIDTSKHYCFVVTAVSIWEQESEPSNEACKMDIAAPDLSQPPPGDLMPALSTTGWKLVTGDDYVPVGDRTTEWQISSDPGFSDTDLIFVLETADPAYLEAIDVPGLVLSPGESYHARVRFKDSVLGISAWSNVIADTPGPDPDDSDPIDGIPDDNVPGSHADLDGDGRIDYREVYTAVGNSVISMEASGGVQIDVIKAVAPNEIPAPPPPGTDLTYGLIKFRLSNIFPIGNTVQVLLEPQHAITGIFKYDLMKGWHAANATNNGNGTWWLTLTDGGDGDADGIVNGIIVDPSGLVTGTTPTSTLQLGDSGGGGGCFIATAVFGSGLAPQAQILKRFRDRFLRPSSAGQAFIELYQHVSPPVADYIRAKPGLKRVIRMALLPVIGVAYVLIVVHPMIFFAGLAILVSFGVMRFRAKGIGMKA